MIIEFKPLRANVDLPQYKTDGANAVDLALPYDAYLRAGEASLHALGFAIHIEHPNVCGFLIPRSGLGSRGVILGNSVGLIDSDYQGEIKVSLWNRTDNDITLDKGERVAQMIFVPTVRVHFREVTEFGVDSLRGSGGFGSTGR